MSRFFPHAAFAEDQPVAHTLLWSHVLYRGFQTGAFIGIFTGSFSAAQQSRKQRKIGQLFTHQAAYGTITWSMGRTALITTVIMVPALLSRMYGREEIEWKDRSWRLLENEGQMEVDDWSLIGTGLGALASAGRSVVTRQRATMKLYRVAGHAGLGSLAGVAGYMVWRYDVKKGQRGSGEVVDS